MIQFLSNTPWNPIWEVKKEGRLLIDLRRCQDEVCILREIGAVLKGSDSRTINGNSLDALTDVMGDWFIEHWGNKAEIYVRGADAIEKRSPRLLAQITECMNHAFDTAEESAKREGRDCPYVEAKKRMTIFFCFDERN